MIIPKNVSSRDNHLLITIVFVAILIALTLGLLSKHRLPAARAQDIPAGKATPVIVSAPNKNFRAAHSRKIDTVVVHYISGINVDAKRWSDPNLVRKILNDNHVSAHYLVDRTGKIYKLVDEKNVAWHAGGSIMPAPDNRRNVNSFSVGIEVIATAKSGFTDAEYRSLAYLINGIESRHPIRNIVGHDQISGIRAVKLGLRKDVKPDPGPLFDWGRLRSMI